MADTTGRPVRVAIAGGGASGALVAAHLALAADANPLQVTIAEPAGRLGRGVAYGTEDDGHLLNVPARGMSALPDDADHFRAWASAGPAEFVCRRRYGDYLEDLLRWSWSSVPPGSELLHLRARVVDANVPPTGPLTVWTDDGGQVEADLLVLATGHGGPSVPGWLPAELLESAAVVMDPWAPNALRGIGSDDHVVCVGTGLTFVDIALSVLAGSPGTRVTAVSRHGLAPQAHVRPLPEPDPPLDLPPGRLRLEPIIRTIRARGAEWRRAVDGLRPQTQEIWQRLDPGDRDRFMRHAARFWDVHRHRMAPEVAAVLDRHAGEGRLALRAVEDVVATADDRRVVLSTADGDLVADRLILCTGPGSDPTVQSLGAALVASGHARPGPYAIGFDVDPKTGALIGADGTADDRLVAIGPLRRGVLGESTAIPEIRVQAQDLARRYVRGGLAAAGR